MRTRPNYLAVVAFVIVRATPLSAQPTPNFAGDWRTESNVPPPPIDPSKPGSASASKSGLTIAQDAKQIVLTGGTLTEAYALDGSESTCTLRIAQKPVAVPCRARWDGRRLVMTYQVPLRGEPRDLTRTLSFDENGTLVIETTDIGAKSGTTHRHVGRYWRRNGIA